MKITDEQRQAASLYWTHILTGEVNSRALTASKQSLPSFMAAVEAIHRRNYLEGLVEKNPMWSLKFMNSLDSLLIDADNDLCLRLEYHPEGFLKQAAEMAEIPEGLFPIGKLSMTFDNQGNIILDGEVINADTLLSDAAKEMPAKTL